MYWVSSTFFHQILNDHSLGKDSINKWKEMTAYLNAGIQTEIHWVVPIMKYQRSRKDRYLMFKALLTMNFISGQNKYSSNYRWNLIHCLYHDTFNTFRTAEWGTRSSRVCSCCPRYKALVPRTLLSLSWKTQWNWNQFQNELPSDEGKELHHFLLHCFDFQISKNTMGSQKKY